MVRSSPVAPAGRHRGWNYSCFVNCRLPNWARWEHCRRSMHDTEAIAMALRGKGTGARWESIQLSQNAESAHAGATARHTFFGADGCGISCRPPLANANKRFKLNQTHGFSAYLGIEIPLVMLCVHREKAFYDAKESHLGRLSFNSSQPFRFLPCLPPRASVRKF